MNKKQKITFGLIVGLIFLLTLGATYAYFSLVVKGNNSANNTVVTAGTLEITYSEGNTINISNIEPGWVSNEKVIYVENTGTVNADYALFWEELYNGFTHKEMLFDLHCTSSEDNDCSTNDIDVTMIQNNTYSYTYDNEAEVPGRGAHKLIKSNYVLEPGEIHTLKVKFYFKETNESQNYNQGKTLTAKFSVGEYIPPVGTLALDWAVKIGYKLAPGSSTNAEGDKVQSITFYNDGRTFSGITPIDVSYEQNNNVLLYEVESTDCAQITTDNGNTWHAPSTCYDINIVGNGTIELPTDSDSLFSSLDNVSSINFNDSVDSSKVENMYSMFSYTGEYSKMFIIDGLGDLDVSSVTNMGWMFSATALKSLTFDFGDLSGWDLSNVTDMGNMFDCTACNATIFNIIGIENWDVSNVTNMIFLFNYAGENSSTFNIDLSNWNTLNVTNMSNMFEGAGSSATVFNIGNLSNWDVSEVTNMNSMFYHTGDNASYTLDLSGWNVSNVTNHNGFNTNVTTKVIEPHWLS